MSEARIEQRWAADGEMSWCIIHGNRIIGFGEPGGKETCERVFVRDRESLDDYCHCRDFILTEPPAPPTT